MIKFIIKRLIGIQKAGNPFVLIQKIVQVLNCKEKTLDVLMIIFVTAMENVLLYYFFNKHTWRDTERYCICKYGYMGPKCDVKAPDVTEDDIIFCLFYFYSAFDKYILIVDEWTECDFCPNKS